jgi:two-component system response regulator FixJ
MSTTPPVARAVAGPTPAREPSRAIFIVDDDEAVRDSLQLLLQTEGFEAFGFGSCTEALDTLQDIKPACLVLDLHLPKMSGLELLRELRARHIVLPVVLITGHLDRKTRAQAIASGVDVVLQKPLSGSDLLDAIRRARHPG